MRIYVQLPDVTNLQLLPQGYDLEVDDSRSVISDICRAIEHQAEFLVSGFGQDRWPVDVATDLAVFLEQLPGAVRAIRSKSETEIDFYEQGIERKIILTPLEGGYLAKCVSQTDWQPNPSTESINAGELEEMLINIELKFNALIQQLFPRKKADEWRRLWASLSHT